MFWVVTLRAPSPVLVTSLRALFPEPLVKYAPDTPPVCSCSSGGCRPGYAERRSTCVTDGNSHRLVLIGPDLQVGSEGSVSCLGRAGGCLGVERPGDLARCSCSEVGGVEGADVDRCLPDAIGGDKGDIGLAIADLYGLAAAGAAGLGQGGIVVIGIDGKVEIVGTSSDA